MLASSGGMNSCVGSPSCVLGRCMTATALPEKVSGRGGFGVILLKYLYRSCIEPL